MGKHISIRNSFKRRQFSYRDKGNSEIVTHLGSTIVIKLVVFQILVMLQVSRVVQLTFMSSIAMILDIKTDTVCIQVTTVFTLIQALDWATYYHVVH